MGHGRTVKTGTVVTLAPASCHAPSEHLASHWLKHDVHHRFLIGFLLLLIPFAASALEACDIPPRYGTGQTAQAIVRTACNEHRLWQRAFIDRNGRIALLGATEAESGSLADDGLVAWQRVGGIAHGDEIHRNHVRALVQHLEEGVLAVGARLAPYHG